MNIDTNIILNFMVLIAIPAVVFIFGAGKSWNRLRIETKNK